ncbi:MAG: right-handed parallel beta-helix repeat-containing protein, partial [Ignavibacteriaceae bacterium]
KYCNIYHADNGIKCNNSLPTISNNLIAYNTTGIYLNNLGNTTTEISNNEIRNNSYQGIYLNNSSPVIGYNTISGNNNYGIQCYNYSHPSIHHNTISSHTSAGVFLNYYSPAYVSYLSSGPGSNKITGNLLGINANYQCNAFVYYNSIHDNTSYEVQATQPVHINAINNWWGANPPIANEFYTDGSATIDYIPALQSDPLGGLAKAASYANNNNSISTSSSFFDAELDLALKHQLAGKYDEAIAIYDKVIQKELNTPKGLYSLVRLEECYWSSGKKSFIGYLNSVVRPNISGKDNISGITLELENHWLINEGKYQNAITNLKKIENDFSLNSEMYKYSLYNIGFIYFYYLNDTEKARESFTELAAKYSNDPLVIDSKILLGEYNINTLYRSDPNAELVLSKKEDQSTSAKNISPIYELIANYPNPFNPSTIISYQIPKDGLVTLKVFDALGREVKTLVNEFKSQGKYSVSFDASNLTSGVYFYQLKAGDFVSIKKMILMK